MASLTPCSCATSGTLLPCSMSSLKGRTALCTFLCINVQHHVGAIKPGWQRTHVEAHWQCSSRQLLTRGCACKCSSHNCNLAKHSAVSKLQAAAQLMQAVLTLTTDHMEEATMNNCTGHSSHLNVSTSICLPLDGLAAVGSGVDSKLNNLRWLFPWLCSALLGEASSDRWYVTGVQTWPRGPGAPPCFEQGTVPSAICSALAAEQTWPRQLHSACWHAETAGRLT